MSLESQTTLANRQGFSTTYTNEFDQPKSALTIITPTTGSRISVKGIYVGTNGTTGKVRVYFPTSANTVANIYAADGGGYIPMIVEGAVNEALKITSTTAAAEPYYVHVNYTEN